MATKKPKMIKRKAVSVPGNLSEAENFVRTIRGLEQQIEAIETKSNAEIAKLETRIFEIKEKAQEEAKLLEKEVDQLAEGVYIFAEGNRPGLTDQFTKKTVELATGDKIRWYLTPPAVRVEDEEEAKKEIKRKGFDDFIRIKEEIDKEAILADPEKVKKLKFISITQDEIFAIILAELGIELQKGKRKFKKMTV